MCLIETQRVFKRYHSVKQFTYKMAAKINWHRYATELRHCHPDQFVRAVNLYYSYNRAASATSVTISGASLHDAVTS